MITLIESRRSGRVMKKGEWHGAEMAGQKRTALVCCPGCGKIASLSGHTIDPDGTVTPSLVCPFDLTCEFHDYVKLADWKA